MNKRKLLHNQFVALGALYRLRDGLEDIGITINSGVGKVGKNDAKIAAVLTDNIYNIIDLEELVSSGYSPDDIEEAVVNIAEAYASSGGAGEKLEKLFWNYVVERDNKYREEFLEKTWGRELL